MKQLIPLLVCMAAIISCNNTEKNKTQVKLPEVLQEEKSSSYVSLRKYGSDDMVNALYSDLVKSNPTLKQLEERITALNESGKDSVTTFKLFDDNNKTYYGSAESHLRQLKDSVLSKKILDLIRESDTTYQSLVASQNNTLTSIANKENQLKDLHIVLKVVKTLAVIEKYQKENQPANKPLENYLNQIGGVNNQMDSLIKQPR